MIEKSISIKEHFYHRNALRKNQRRYPPLGCRTTEGIIRWAAHMHISF